MFSDNTEHSSSSWGGTSCSPSPSSANPVAPQDPIIIADDITGEEQSTGSSGKESSIVRDYFTKVKVEVKDKDKKGKKKMGTAAFIMKGTLGEWCIQ